MCEKCDQRLDRRAFFRAAGAAAFGAAMAPALATAAAPAGGPNLPPDEALKRLRDGNARYVASPDLCVSDLAGQRKAATAGQRPFATVLGCADSRAAPELLFGGVGKGELFVARNAGNLADDIVLGTLEYGSLVLGSSVIVVLGHQSCGAVAAACEQVEKNVSFPGPIQRVVDPILPAALAVRGKSGDFLDNAIRESARATARRLAERSRVLGKLVDEGKLKIAPAYFEFASGKVEWL